MRTPTAYFATQQHLAAHTEGGGIKKNAVFPYLAVGARFALKVEATLHPGERFRGFPEEHSNSATPLRLLFVFVSLDVRIAAGLPDRTNALGSCQ